MELFEAIQKRYSYRDAFKDAPVPKEDLINIVEAGLKAPSGCNSQSTTFVIADDPRILAEIKKTHTMRAVQDAKAFIAAIVNKTPKPVYGEMSFEVEDCSAAVQNMLLAVTALGYATVWIDGALRNEGRAEKINSLLGVPAGKTVRILLPIGIPAGDGPRRQKKSFDERAWFNRHG